MTRRAKAKDVWLIVYDATGTPWDEAEVFTDRSDAEEFIGPFTGLSIVRYTPAPAKKGRGGK